MGSSDASAPRFAELLELAESKFRRWQARKLQPERERRTKEIKDQHRDMRPEGRTVFLLRLEGELLTRECQQRIAFYSEVSRGHSSQEMLFELRLQEFRDRIMTSVRASIESLRGRLEREAGAQGLPLPERFKLDRFEQLQAKLQDVVERELRVLQAEGALMNAGDLTTAKVSEDVVEARDEQLPAMQSEPEIRSSSTDVRTIRAAKVLDYKRDWKAHGIKKTYQTIAKEANPGWNDRTPVSKYLRDEQHPKHVAAIEKVLSKRPPSKIVTTKTTKTTKR